MTRSQAINKNENKAEKQTPQRRKSPNVCCDQPRAKFKVKTKKRISVNQKKEGSSSAVTHEDSMKKTSVSSSNSASNGVKL
jgi:hypothetical protein